MGITIKDLVIPELMKAGWQIAPRIYRKEHSLAFARWTSHTSDNCCPHCLGEWALVLYFSTTNDKRELIRLCTDVWRGFAPPWVQKHWDAIIVITDHSGGFAEELRRQRRQWLDSFGQDENFRCEAPNFHHWPVVWCRID
jgi:hypothetical protein